MSDRIFGKGHCLCGAVKFTTSKLQKNVGACHCRICRKWGGGALMAVECGSEVVFDDEDQITTYDSSTWAERGFCKQCGSHLFYRLKETSQHFIPAGLFDEPQSFTFDHQVFIDEKPSYYDFSNKTQDMTGAEVFAKYEASDS